MIPFTEWIKVDNFPTEFNFRKVYVPNRDKFFVSTADAEKNNISFDIEMNVDGKWHILNPAPQFIIQIKEQLIAILVKHCRLQPVYPWDRLCQIALN